MVEPFWTRHRGPFVLLLGRPHPSAKKALAGHHTSEWLRGSVEHGADAVIEALALMDDPRDTIDLVSIYSESEGCFVGSYRKVVDRGEV